MNTGLYFIFLLGHNCTNNHQRQTSAGSHTDDFGKGCSHKRAIESRTVWKEQTDACGRAQNRLDHNDIAGDPLKLTSYAKTLSQAAFQLFACQLLVSYLGHDWEEINFLHYKYPVLLTLSIILNILKYFTIAVV